MSRCLVKLCSEIGCVVGAGYLARDKWSYCDPHYTTESTEEVSTEEVSKRCQKGVSPVTGLQVFVSMFNPFLITFLISLPNHLCNVSL